MYTGRAARSSATKATKKRKYQWNCAGGSSRETHVNYFSINQCYIFHYLSSEREKERRKNSSFPSHSTKLEEKQSFLSFFYSPPFGVYVKEKPVISGVYKRENFPPFGKKHKKKRAGEKDLFKCDNLDMITKTIITIISKATLLQNEHTRNGCLCMCMCVHGRAAFLELSPNDNESVAYMNNTYV
jgi:hypothetical protein